MKDTFEEAANLEAHVEFMNAEQSQLSREVRFKNLHRR